MLTPFPFPVVGARECFCQFPRLFGEAVRPRSSVLGALLLQAADPGAALYDVLWIVVFAFATLNIISLGARQFEPNKRRMNIGEFLAVLVVIFSIVLLCWELLHLFHIFPIHLSAGRAFAL